MTCRHRTGTACAVQRRGLVGPRTGARLVGTYALHKLGATTRTAVQASHGLRERPRPGSRSLGCTSLQGRLLGRGRSLRHAGFACYAGRTLDELRALMQELHELHMRPQISPAMRARVAAHRRAGDRLVVITASAFFFAEPLVRELEIDDLVGTQVGFEDGRCTGRVCGAIVEGVEKLAAARRIAAERGAALDACTFYSDHVADLPLLEAVGRPVAVGPDAALRALARARGWDVVDHAR